MNYKCIYNSWASRIKIKFPTGRSSTRKRRKHVKKLIVCCIHSIMSKQVPWNNNYAKCCFPIEPQISNDQTDGQL